jgi:hypothetical protein
MNNHLEKISFLRKYNDISKIVKISILETSVLDYRVFENILFVSSAYNIRLEIIGRKN